MTLIKIRPNLVLGTFGYIRGLFTDQFAPPLGAQTIVAVAIAVASGGACAVRGARAIAGAFPPTPTRHNRPRRKRRAPA